jgi:ABC-type glycerol-3-phosphate transport system substrate-binding protein
MEATMVPEVQLSLFEIEGWLPPRSELFNSDQAQNVDPTGQYLDTLRVAGENTMARPVTSVWSDQSSVIAEQANRVVAQNVSAAEGMTTLQSELEDIEG